MSGRPDHRVPGYMGRAVTASELRTRNARLMRRLLVMAWPGTAVATLHRLDLDCMSFASEKSGEGDGILSTTIVADITHRDLRRNAQSCNPDGPLCTVSITFEQEEQEQGARGDKAPTPRVTSTRITVRRDPSDPGEGADSIEEAVLRMTLAQMADRSHYRRVSGEISQESAPQRESRLMQEILDMKG